MKWFDFLKEPTVDAEEFRKTQRIALSNLEASIRSEPPVQNLRELISVIKDIHWETGFNGEIANWVLDSLPNVVSVLMRASHIEMLCVDGRSLQKIVLLCAQEDLQQRGTVFKISKVYNMAILKCPQEAKKFASFFEPIYPVESLWKLLTMAPVPKDFGPAEKYKSMIKKSIETNSAIEFEMVFFPFSKGEVLKANLPLHREFLKLFADCNRGLIK